MTYIHYGSKRYDPTAFRAVEPMFPTKPMGGFWGSPVDTDWGWAQWCGAEWPEAIKSDSFRFEIVGRVFVVDSLPNLEQLAAAYPANVWGQAGVDFAAVAREYAAVRVTAKGHWATRRTYPLNTYTWDCDSVVVLRPDAVRVVE